MSIFENDEEDELVRSYFEGAMRLMHPAMLIEFDLKTKEYKGAFLHMFWSGFVFSMKFHGIKPPDRKWSGGDPYEIKKPHLKLVD